jgi:hypothetical protein
MSLTKKKVSNNSFTIKSLTDRYTVKDTKEAKALLSKLNPEDLLGLDWSLSHWAIMFLISKQIYSTKLEEVCYTNSHFAYKFLTIFPPYSLKNRSKLEETLINHPKYCYNYAVNILKKRFPVGEPTLTLDPYYNPIYLDFLKTLRDD